MITKTVISYLINKGYTSRKSAERLGVSKKDVLRAAKHYGLNYNNIPKRFDTVDSIVIKKLIKRGYKDTQIAKLLNINRQSVNRICNKNNINREYKANLTKREKAILIGTLLGDASLNKQNRTRFSFEHSYKQKEYCEWKAKQFSSIPVKVKTSTRKTIDKRNKKYYRSTTAFSKSYSDLNNWYDLLYKETKQIPKALLKYYNSLSLAIHFMDDGSKNSSSYSLATHCFSKNDLVVFNNMCKRKFGISWNINKSGQLYLPTKYKDIFTNLVKQYIHPTLIYKLHLS